MGQDRLGLSRREADGEIGRGRLAARRQGAEGRSHRGDSGVGLHVADDHDLDRRRVQGRADQRLEFAEVCRGELVGVGEGPAQVAGVQQLAGLDAEGAGGRGGDLGERARVGRADPLEGLRPERRIGRIGGQGLHLDIQILWTGRTRQGETLVRQAEARRIDLGGKDGFHVLAADAPEAALDQRCGGRPGRQDAVVRQGQAAAREVDADQHLVLAEIGRFDGQAHAVGEADGGDADVGDLGAFRDPAGRAEVRIGPGLGLGLDAGRDGRSLRLGEGGHDRVRAALDRIWR